MSPRLVASDLDGTLVRSDRTIGGRSVAALVRVAAAGVPVVLATGRPIRWLHVVYDQLPIRPLAVCANGAAVYDPEADEIRHATTLSPDVLAEACHRLRSEIPGVAFAVELDGGRHLRYEAAYQVGPWDAEHGSVCQVPAADLITAPAAKLLVRAGEQVPDEFTARVGACLVGLGEATHSSNSGLVEVSAAGVTKAAGLAWVADRLGVPREHVLAFGDMPNDLPMLRWAGLGVAVANGHRQVLAEADDVAPANDDEGVAAYLERLFPGPAPARQPEVSAERG